MPPNNVLSDDDRRVWQAVTSGIRPLAGRPDATIEICIEVRQDKAVQSVASTLSLPAPPPRLALPRPLDPLDHGRADNLDSSLQDRFRKGKLPIEAILDLHGLSQDQAHGALLEFLPRCVRQRMRCVMVITGKGRSGVGILRNQVPRWLNMSPLRGMLLAFTYAVPRHGGEGALYILLKRQRATS